MLKFDKRWRKINVYFSSIFYIDNNDNIVRYI